MQVAQPSKPFSCVKRGNAQSSLFSRQAGTTAGAAWTRSLQRSCEATSAEGTLAALDGATVCARPRGETSAERPLAGSGGAGARSSGATSAEGALVASGGATVCNRPHGAASGGHQHRNPSALCTQPQDAGVLPSPEKPLHVFFINFQTRTEAVSCFRWIGPSRISCRQPNFTPSSAALADGASRLRAG